MDFKYSEEDEAFRHELRNWLEANVPKDWRDDGELADPDTKTELRAGVADGIASSTTPAGCVSIGPKSMAVAGRRSCNNWSISRNWNARRHPR